MSIIDALIIIIILGGTHVFVRASEDENRLIHYLFSEQGYNPLVRPTEHSNETVVVAFGLLLVQLIHVSTSSTTHRAETLSGVFLLSDLGLRKGANHEDEHVAAYEMVTLSAFVDTRTRTFTILGTTHNYDGIPTDMVRDFLVHSWTRISRLRL